MKDYFHSVILNESKCLGCTNCIKSCPTQAIRVRNGKALIIKERCIDCGECIKVCPYHAKDAIADSLEDIKRYPYKVAMVAPTFLSQFGGNVSTNAILTAVKSMGFDEVREVAYSAEILGKVLNKELNKDGANLPKISSACPAIVRLIQVRFPELLPKVDLLESPMEVEARFIRKELMEKGFNNKDIGIFFITPCPAKITSIKKPIGSSEDKSAVDGALAIKDVYMEVHNNIKSLKKIENLQRASQVGINWARTGGESKFADACYINVDGIKSVSKVLEEIERDKLKGIVFIEGLACRGGCVGGALVVENNFIAKQRIHQIASKSKSENNFTQDQLDELYNSGILHQTSALTPRLVRPLDENIAIAIKKAEEIEEIVKRLPGIDCGSCGSPSCLALAEDIVNGSAEEVDCIFLLREELKTLAKNMVDLSVKVPPVMLEKNREKEDNDESK